MNIHRIQGWLLIASAICLPLSLVLPGSNLSQALDVIGTILLIVGIPAIQTAQKGGLFGWIGILFVEIAALIPLLFVSGLLNDLAFGGAMGLVSAIVGMVGRFIIGWLTIRRKTFPAWVGWTFLLGGVLNLLGGIIDFGLLAVPVYFLSIFLEVLALLGYGYILVRYRPGLPDQSKSTL